MSTTTKLIVGTANTTILSTELNSLSAAGQAVSTTILDNTAGLDFLVDFWLQIKYTSSAPSAGTIAMDLWLLPSLDGSTYAAGATGGAQGALYVGSFESREGSTSTLENLMLIGIPLGPYKYKALVVNQSGKTLAASGNILSYATSKVQSV